MSARSRQPFVIVPKPLLSTIVQQVDGTDAAFCSAVAVALRWVANDAGEPDGPVPATITQIAHRCGLSYNSTSKAIGILESIGVLRVERQKIAGTKANAPSLYTFPTLEGTTFPTMCGTFPTEAPHRRAEIDKEEAKERKERETPPSFAPLALSSDDLEAIAADLGTNSETVAECLQTFNEVKAAWPNDPRTPAAFKGWMRTAPAAKGIVARVRTARPAPKAAILIAEPIDWQRWIDAHQPGTAHATGGVRHCAWHQKRPDEQTAIARLIADERDREEVA